MAPGQALARAHAVARVVRDEDLGRTKGMRPRRRGCGTWRRCCPGPTTAPVVVLGAVVHAEIGGRGVRGGERLVARAAEHLVLVSGGLDPYAVIVVEAGHAGDPAGYRAGLAARERRGQRGRRGGSSPVPRRSPGARSSRQRPRMERREGGGHDAAPTLVGAVPGTSAASDQACFINVLAPVPSVQLPVRRWVIAAWVLVCRARTVRLVRRRLRIRVPDAHFDDSAFPWCPLYALRTDLERAMTPDLTTRRWASSPPAWEPHWSLQVLLEPVVGVRVGVAAATSR